MQRITRALIVGCAVVTLAACSHKNNNAPLSYVPANTPYLIANLKPLTPGARAALVPASAASVVRAHQVMQLRHAADSLTAKHENDLANLLRAFADNMNGKTYAQMEIDAGINPDGLFAIYGLGLSPVVRGQLSDPAKFHAYIAKLEKAYGHTFAKGTIGKATYQYVRLGQSYLQAIIATHDKQFVLAILPAQADKQQLRLALGLVHPEHSVQRSGRLKQLASTNGYGPYAIGYFDTARLPALIAGARDPMLKALLASSPGKQASQLTAKLSAGCKGDLARIAARVPMISFGYTTLKAKERIQQVDIQLAPDIVKAFQDVGAAVPGLDQDSASKALAGVAFALPIPKIRNFWLHQADEVKSDPFTCPALASLNKLATTAGKYLPKLSMPPVGELRGLRLVVDQYVPGGQGQTPMFHGRVLIASHDPNGLLNMARAMVPALSQLKLTDNGKPVKLPDSSTSHFKLNEPVWVAMNKKALAIGIGKGEKASLAAMLAAPVGQGDTLSSSHVDGKFYVLWFSMMHKQMAAAEAKALAANPEDAKAKAASNRVQAEMAAVQAIFKQIKNVSTHTSLTDHGIRITADTRLR